MILTFIIFISQSDFGLYCKSQERIFSDNLFTIHTFLFLLRLGVQGVSLSTCLSLHLFDWPTVFKLSKDPKIIRLVLIFTLHFRLRTRCMRSCPMWTVARTWSRRDSAASRRSSTTSSSASSYSQTCCPGEGLLFYISMLDMSEVRTENNLSRIGKKENTILEKTFSGVFDSFSRQQKPPWLNSGIKDTYFHYSCFRTNSLKLETLLHYIRGC